MFGGSVLIMTSAKGGRSGEARPRFLVDLVLPLLPILVTETNSRLGRGVSFARLALSSQILSGPDGPGFND